MWPFYGNMKHFYTKYTVSTFNYFHIVESIKERDFFNQDFRAECSLLLLLTLSLSLSHTHTHTHTHTYIYIYARARERVSL
jgi:hypothetical protein